MLSTKANEPNAEPQLTEMEIGERCNAIIKNLDEGKSPDANEIKFLISTDVVSRNMRNPENGPIGKFAAKMMENVNRNQCVGSAEKCNLKPDESVLEIGTGGHGFAMEKLLKTKGLKKLVGIEISDSLRAQVAQKFEKEIQRNELTLVGTDCKDLKEIFPIDDSVDCILAINVVYFLHPLGEYLKEMYRVLKPKDGRILLSCKENIRNTTSVEDETTVFKNTNFDQIAAKCKEAGFKVEIEEVHFEENPAWNNFVLIKLKK